METITLQCLLMRFGINYFKLTNFEKEAPEKLRNG